jgi:hypothetical protein
VFQSQICLESKTPSGVSNSAQNGDIKYGEP